eukprot:gene7581-17067_t
MGVSPTARVGAATPPLTALKRAHRAPGPPAYAHRAGAVLRDVGDNAVSNADAVAALRAYASDAWRRRPLGQGRVWKMRRQGRVWKMKRQGRVWKLKRQ